MTGDDWSTFNPFKRHRSLRSHAQTELLGDVISLSMASADINPLRLRMYAIIGVGTMRIAADRWSVDGCNRPLLDYLDDGFKMIDEERSESAG